jgi:ATP-dependent DNA ligase
MTVAWPLAPMLARLTRHLPEDGFLFEPKWDGFRCLARRIGTDVDLRSRTGRPLARYFPEVVTALRGLATDRFVVDGEVMVGGEHPDFAALMARLHPSASRVARLAAETPASMVLFDALEVGSCQLVGHRFADRRRALEALTEHVEPPLSVTEITADVALAQRWLDAPPGRGIDGVMAKHPDLHYRPGKRAMFKVKAERTAECVWGGFRMFANRPELSSLLLGLYSGEVLHHVGVASSFSAARRRELIDELAPAMVPLRDHPWRDGFALEGGPMGRLPGSAGRWTPSMGLDWVPLRPDRVVEVAYDQVDGIRFRHPARFRRWRPDRDTASCTVDQLREAPWPHA